MTGLKSFKKKKETPKPKAPPALTKKGKPAEKAKKKKLKIAKPSRAAKAPKGKKISKTHLQKKVTMKQPSEVQPGKMDSEPIRQMLLEMRERFLAEKSTSRIPENLASSTDIGDLVDQAGDERDRELSLLLTSRDKEKLLAIDEALEKLDEGTYGICEECGEKIGAGRLKVMPLAKSCVNCQEKFEKEISLMKRTEEDLTYRNLSYSPGLDEEEA